MAPARNHQPQPQPPSLSAAVGEINRQWREAGVDFAAGQQPSLQQIAEFMRLSGYEHLGETAPAERELCAELGRAVVAIQRHRAWASGGGATRGGSAAFMTMYATLNAAAIELQGLGN